MMLDTKNAVMGLGGCVILAASVRLFRHRFSAEAREARRRRRSHGRVVSTRNYPMVKLAVETEKPREDRRGRG